MTTFGRLAEEWIERFGAEAQGPCTAQPVPDMARIPAASAASQPMPCDASDWLPEFERWASEHCVFRDRCFGGIKSLHKHFSDWCIKTSSVPCDRAVFESLLVGEGFSCNEEMVYGLILAEDERYRQQRAKRWEKGDGPDAGHFLKRFEFPGRFECGNEVNVP